MKSLWARMSQAAFRRSLRLNAERPLIGCVLLFAAAGFLAACSFLKGLLLPLFRLLLAPRHPVLVRPSEANFQAAGVHQLGYQFKGSFFELPISWGSARPRMHFVDERPSSSATESPDTCILCIHGSFSWSFSFRKIIPDLLSAGYRVVVPDLIGFGKSDKYVDAQNYNHEFHTWSIRCLMDLLGLNSYNTVLVCSDWGATIGLSLLKDTPEAFSSLVLINAELPVGLEHQDLMQQNVVGQVNKALTRILCREVTSFCGSAFPLRLFYRYLVGLSEDVAGGYMAPFPNHLHTSGAIHCELVPIYKDDPVAAHMIEARCCLKLWGKPVLLIYGQQDRENKDNLLMFQRLLPDADALAITDGSYFIVETHGPQLANQMVQFLRKRR